VANWIRASLGDTPEDNTADGPLGGNAFGTSLPSLLGIPDKTSARYVGIRHNGWASEVVRWQLLCPGVLQLKLFADVYPMARKAYAGKALREFVLEYGSPDDVTINGSKEQNAKGTEFMKTCQPNDVRVTRTEPERPNQNPAEGVIHEVLGRWFCTMIREQVPRKVWDYGIQWTAQVMQRTSTQAGSLRGECPLQEVMGETVDMSEYLDFGFYGHVSHKENAGLGPTLIERWLGVSHRAGGLMSYWVGIYGV
jgi:hypothetical protein